MKILAELTGGVVLILIFAYGVRYLVNNLTIIKEEPHVEQQPTEPPSAADVKPD